MEIERMKYLAELMFWPLADLILALIWIGLILAVAGAVVGILEGFKDGEE